MKTVYPSFYVGRNIHPICDDISTFDDDVIKNLDLTSDDVTTSEFCETFGNLFLHSYLISVQSRSQSDFITFFISQYFIWECIGISDLSSASPRQNCCKINSMHAINPIFSGNV